MKAVPLRNFHLPLPEDVYQALRDEAGVLRRPATAVAREAIEDWLRERRRAAVREAIAAYASRQAGTADDLDPSLERASLDLWSEAVKASHGRGTSRPRQGASRIEGAGGPPKSPRYPRKKRPKQ